MFQNQVSESEESSDDGDDENVVPNDESHASASALGVERSDTLPELEDETETDANASTGDWTAGHGNENMETRFFCVF